MNRHDWSVSEDEIKNSTPAESYEQLYKNTARETLSYLKSATFEIPIPDKEGLPMDSTALWEPYDFVSNPEAGKETAGFGSYGPLEKFFGDEPGEIEVNGRKVKIAFEHFSGIYYDCLTEMIRNSYRCLKLINREYNEAIV